MIRAAPWAALLVLMACAEPEPGALAPQTVSSLATQVGDARGVGASGVYAVQLTREECGCQDVDPSLWALTLCHRAFGQLRAGLPLQAAFEIVASDGIIDLASDTAIANPVGPLDADGSFDAGAVTRLTSLAASGYQITRVDGALDELDELDYEIEGRVRRRLIGRVELLGMEGVVTGVEDVDCVDELSFVGERYIIR